MKLRIFTYTLLALFAGVAISCDKDDKSLDATGTYKGKTEIHLTASENVTVDKLKRYDETFEESVAAVAKNISKSKAVMVTFTMGFLPAAAILDFTQTSADNSGAEYSVAPKEIHNSTTGLLRMLKVTGAKSASYKKSGDKETFNFVLEVEAILKVEDFAEVKYTGTIHFTTK